MNTTASLTCRHTLAPVGSGVQVVACAGCGEVAWFENGAWLEPAEGVARVFGEFTLIGRLPALAAPAAEVLAYRPPSRRARAVLAAFPEHAWVEAAPDLWLSHDGEHLLLAPTPGARAAI